LARPFPTAQDRERPGTRASRSSTQSGEGRLVADGDGGGARSVVTGTASSGSGSTTSGGTVGGSTVTSESTSTTSASTATLSGLASRGGSELALDLEEDLFFPLLLLLGGGGLLLLQACVTNIVFLHQSLLALSTTTSRQRRALTLAPEKNSSSCFWKTLPTNSLVPSTVRPSNLPNLASLAA